MTARECLEQRALASAAALVGWMERHISADESELLLLTMGDLIRLGAGLPQPLRRWARTAGSAEIGAGARVAGQRLRSQPLPSAFACDRDLREEAVLERDRVESVLAAIRFIAVARAVPPVALVESQELREAVDQFDGALGERLDRAAVEDALGDRRALLRGMSDWTAAFRGEDPAEALEPDGSQAAGDLLGRGALPDVAMPPDDVVAEFVGRGLHAGRVEGAASRNEAFRERLAETVRAFVEMDEPASLVARMWSAKHRTQDTPTITIPQELAASPECEQDAGDCESIDLGRLSPLPVEAMLTPRQGNRVELAISDPNHLLAEVSFGEVRAPAGDAAGVWRLAITFSDQPILLRVRAISGASFETPLQLRLGRNT